MVNGQPWPPHSSAGETATTLQLYRNNGAAGFENVTEQAGVAIPLYGMGIAVGDYDNDGDRDVFISGYLRHLFLVNRGDGTVVEATQRVGIGAGTWGTGTAFVDYDRDGWLDLVLGSYVRWTPELESGLDCTYGTPNKDYCPVRYFEGEGISLYRNQGDGTFRDVTRVAGVASPGTRAFTPAIFDFDDDGWPDIFVASDGTPSRLWRNRGDGTFEDVGVKPRIVLDESGRRMPAWALTSRFRAMTISSASPLAILLASPRPCIAVCPVVIQGSIPHCMPKCRRVSAWAAAPCSP